MNILSIQVIRFNGTDFAQTKNQERASTFEFVYFRGSKFMWRHVVEGIDR